ncbi:outer membrane beta-barrel protein [Hymenobacter volaticus]|uniref:PorT family protein n=1 Tax=Hymenobacter volaticus TaxID=2932254 RepID=A0ABY4GE01_9BACT|nr:outer membrane beta-barrel protein [Hymenobacter volaticus]UOQ69148.1 PorT family protein [Hymenobacter volaticus]
MGAARYHYRGPGYCPTAEGTTAGWACRGLLAQVPFTPQGHLFGQTELLFNQQGYRLSHPETNYKARPRTSYLSLPVLVGVTSHHFFVLAGPQVNYVAAEREQYTSNGTLHPLDENPNTDASYYQRWQGALTGAVGYRFG